MSTSAIILMVIGCVGLWGGFGVSCAIALGNGKKKKQVKHKQAQAENK